MNLTWEQIRETFQPIYLHLNQIGNGYEGRISQDTAMRLACRMDDWDAMSSIQENDQCCIDQQTLPEWSPFCARMENEYVGSESIFTITYKNGNIKITHWKNHSLKNFFKDYKIVIL